MAKDRSTGIIIGLVAIAVVFIVIAFAVFWGAADQSDKQRELDRQERSERQQERDIDAQNENQSSYQRGAQKETRP